MPFDFLFPRRSRVKETPELREPRLEMPPDTPRPPPKQRVPQLTSPTHMAWSHYMSPRQMANWAHEMYMAGAMNWQEYLVAMPAELHPDYDLTVGALTGEPARPDHPRDMLVEWEEKLAFVKRHNDWDADGVRRTERIVTLLRRQAKPQPWNAAS
jgi:hypothetical protein